MSGGGDPTNDPYCAETLTGPFCQLCAQREADTNDSVIYHYVAASEDAVAHCAPCEDTLANTARDVLLFGGAALLLLSVLALTWRLLMPQGWKLRLQWMNETFTPKNKLKV